MPQPYIDIVHSGNTVPLSQFVEDNGIVLGDLDGDIFTIDNLYAYQENDQRIQCALRPEEQVTSASDAIVHSGVVIRAPKDRIDKETVATGGKIVVNNGTFEAFLDERVKEILADTDYRPVNIDGLEHERGKTFRFINECTVWIWCKALGKETGSGKIINVTPFIEGINTNVGDNGGNFTLKLAPIVGSIQSTEGGKWLLDQGAALQYAYNDKRNIVSRAADSHYTRMTDGKEAFKQRLFLFHNIIQSNDVVFIKYETLESERLKREEEIGNLTLDSLVIDPSQLISGDGAKKKQLFDMIGLVDTNHQSRSSANADFSIQIGGRDLMKLLLEDGAYFFPTDIAGISGGVQGEKKTAAIKRLLTGEFNMFNAFVDRTIDFSMRFVFNMLSNIRICNEDLFRSYGAERTTRYEYAKVTDTSTPTETLEETPVEGIWQIIKLAIDPVVADRRLVDTSIMSDQGSLKSFIDGKIIQNPFVEFYGDTYGNQYFFMIRKPPFNKESMLSNVKLAINVTEEDVYSESLQWNDEDVYSWYRIIPRGNFYGDDESVALTYFPAIFFEEYANIWGSRPYQVVSNYIDYKGIRAKEHTIGLDHLVEQAYQDLAFMIQSNCYLPFSRKGTITLKGDRRIKRGNLIRLVSTGEIFHVDSVSNFFSVNEGTTERGTTLAVSRGLKERFIDGFNVFVPSYSDGSGQGKYRKISYFDIISMKENTEGVAGTKNFIVDKDVFNFFLRRMQVDNQQGGAVSSNVF